jgi:hypothetical protein
MVLFLEVSAKRIGKEDKANASRPRNHAASSAGGACFTFGAPALLPRSKNVGKPLCTNGRIMKELYSVALRVAIDRTAAALRVCSVPRVWPGDVRVLSPKMLVAGRLHVGPGSD